MTEAALLDIRKSPPAWRRWPETEKVLDALISAGGAARFVGGCVRDAFLGLETADIDIATDLPPEEVMAAFEAAGIRAIPTGLDHGTVTAVIEARHFEITTLRVDVKSHGRHADVAFTKDWAKDAARRDFTFNALYLDPDGELHDPVDGFQDLQARHVRFIGSARARIKEDRLRILRFFRFFARFGEDKADAEALEACRELAGDLRKLSTERVQKEFLRLLMTDNPVPALTLMAKIGVLDILFGTPCNPERLRRLLALPGAKDIPLRLAALADGSADKAAIFDERLGLSKRDSARLLALTGGEVTADLTAEARARLLYSLGADIFTGQTLLLWSAGESRTDFQDYLDQAASWQQPEFPVAGRDLRGEGVQPGPALGALLAEMEARWIASGFALSKDELMALYRSGSLNP